MPIPVPTFAPVKSALVSDDAVSEVGVLVGVVEDIGINEVAEVDMDIVLLDFM